MSFAQLCVLDELLHSACVHGFFGPPLPPRNQGDDDAMAALGLNSSPQLCITRGTREGNKAACCLFHSPAVKALSHQAIEKKLQRVIAYWWEDEKKKKKRPRGVSLRKRGVKIGDFAPCIFSPQVQSRPMSEWIVQNFSAKPANRKKKRDERERARDNGGDRAKR